MSGWGPRTDEGSQGTVVIFPVSAITQFQQALSVPANLTQNVLDYTTPPSGKALFLNKVEFGGSNIGNYNLIISGIEAAQYYTHFCDLNGSWTFDAMNGGLPIGPNIRILVTVNHPRPMLGDFYARLNMVSP